MANPMMALYSAALTLGLLLSSPWWLLRLFTTERYREGLRQRLGFVPVILKSTVQGQHVLWLHAVSVGEVLAASKLIPELESKLESGWRVVISTTTRTGQALARQRFGEERVFYYPLDFAWAVRAYLRVLRPAVLILMESELWPRMLHECRRAGIPVSVVNARVSDRSFKRGMLIRSVWGRLLHLVSLWLVQSTEDADRLLSMGASKDSIRSVGNLKYDVLAPKGSSIATLISQLAQGRPVIVAGSTVGDPKGERHEGEEEPVIRSWASTARDKFGALLVLAPRHPERFGIAESLACEYPYIQASAWTDATEVTLAKPATETQNPIEIVLLDTIGDLAAVYGIADIAFVGGSLVRRGGHNPLEPAQFGIPVIMGPSFENFRDIVGKMQAEDAIRIVQNEGELESALTELLDHPKLAGEMGKRGQQVFEQQQGATERTVRALMQLINPTTKAAGE